MFLKQQKEAVKNLIFNNLFFNMIQYELNG